MQAASRTLLKLKQGPKLVRTNFSWQVYAKPLKKVTFPVSIKHNFKYRHRFIGENPSLLVLAFQHPQASTCAL